MNKFTKISATALFALFLTACDKVADQTKATTPEAPAAKTVEAPKTDVVASEQQALDDFNKLFQWKLAQEQKFVSVQQELEQHIASQDKDKLAQALDVFNAKVGDIVKELDTLDIKSADVKTFKDKARENLTLLSGLIVESVKAMNDPKPELQSDIQEKTEMLQKSTAELKQIQAELTQKYLKKQ